MARSNKTVENISPTDYSALKRAEQQESTRSMIATIFVGGYLVVLAGLIILSTFFKLPSDSAKDYLLAIGSPLGFIIGFYFKSSEKH